VEGNNQKNAGVSSKLETRKMLGRILKARLLIVGNNVAGRVEKHITLVATKEQLDCADQLSWHALPESGLATQLLPPNIETTLRLNFR
jgi:hypothetical protein